MNQGGEPVHGDDGLPRIDVEIPDDARELSRDVQAYHRELRALRRQQRSSRMRSFRLRAPLRRSGLILPLVAGCLALTLIAGVVLAMFSASPYFSGLGGPARTSSAAGASSLSTSASPSASASPTTSASRSSTSPSTSGSGTAAPARSAGARLPGKTISVSGKPVALRTLTSTALAIIPAQCACMAALQQLLAQANLAGVTIYLIGPRESATELARLAAISGPGNAMVGTDAAHVLGSTYRPSGLTVLLVDSRGAVTVAAGLRSGLQLEKRLQLLKPTT